MRLLASRVFGEMLDQLVQEADHAKHWPLIRAVLFPRAQLLQQDVMQYVPVWLFLGQTCQAFEIGPVRFIERKDWLKGIARRRGQDSPWMPGVRKLWSGRRLRGGSSIAGLGAALRAFRREPTRPGRWTQAFIAGRRFAEPKSITDARTVARLVHPDQWIACAEVEGFDSEEARRRGLLAARVALDTIRLAVPGKHRHLIATAADSVLPLSVDRLSQVAGQDLAHGWRINRPGLSGAPGLAQDIVGQAAPLFAAAGACISAAVTTNPVHPCPELAERWFNSTHWFGRACLADADFVAVVMLVIALDVLCGGLQEAGILELVARLTGTPMSAAVLDDGTTLKKLVERTYKLRSEVAHGSVLAVHEPLDTERAQLESLAAAAIATYVIELQSYSQAGSSDDRDAFRRSLPPAQP